MRLVDEDFSPKKQSEYLDSLFMDLQQNGMPIHEIMDMPYNYMLQIMEDRQKPKESASFFDLMG